MRGVGHFASIRIDLDAAAHSAWYQFCKVCVILMMRVSIQACARSSSYPYREDDMAKKAKKAKKAAATKKVAKKTSAKKKK